MVSVHLDSTHLTASIYQNKTAINNS